MDPMSVANVRRTYRLSPERMKLVEGVTHNNDLDVKFVVGVKEVVIMANISCIAMNSEVFDLMLMSKCWIPKNRSGLEEETVRVVVLKEYKAKYFRALVDFLMGRDIAVEFEHVEWLLSIARMYMVQDLVNACVDVAKQNISVENVMRVLDTAAQRGSFEIVEICVPIICRNAKMLIGYSDFEGLSEEAVSEIFKMDELEMHELAVFNQLCKWARFRYDREHYDSDSASAAPHDYLRVILGKKLKYLLRPRLIHPSDITYELLPTGLFTKDEQLAMLSYPHTRCLVRGYEHKPRIGGPRPLGIRRISLDFDEIKLRSGKFVATKMHEGCYSGVVKKMMMRFKMGCDAKISSVTLSGPIEPEFQMSYDVSFELRSEDPIWKLAGKCQRKVDYYAHFGDAFHVNFFNNHEFKVEGNTWYQLHYTVKGPQLNWHKDFSAATRIDENLHHEEINLEVDHSSSPDCIGLTLIQSLNIFV